MAGGHGHESHGGGGGASAKEKEMYFWMALISFTNLWDPSYNGAAKILETIKSSPEKALEVWQGIKAKYSTSEQAAAAADKSGKFAEMLQPGAHQHMEAISKSLEAGNYAAAQAAAEKFAAWSKGVHAPLEGFGNFFSLGGTAEVPRAVAEKGKAFVDGTTAGLDYLRAVLMS